MKQAPWLKLVIKLVGLAACAGVFLALAPMAFAQVGQPPTLDAVSAKTDEAHLAINAMWMLLAAALVFLMALGFAFVETGFTRAKNVAHTMGMNLMVLCIGVLGYWLSGFAFQFGAVNYAWPAVSTEGAVFGAWAHAPISLGDWGDLLAKPLIKIGDQIGILGGSGFMLAGITMNVGILTYFMYQAVFMNVAATIPTGAMAERIKFSGFCLMSLFTGMFLYPLIGNWVWGGGWLQNLGRIAGLGNGAVDFAGSGVVHMVGGTIALVGVLVLGPRLGRFNQDGSVNQIPGHNLPLGMAGAIILFFGWFGFNAGSSYGFVGGFGQLAANAAVNTLISGAAGGVAAMCYMWWLSPVKKPDPIMSVNGVLGACVAITTPCAFVDSAGAVIIGLVAGVLVCMATGWLESVNIDDAAGAVPVHLVCGAWGLLSLGIFAIGDPVSRGWNGVDAPVTGILYNGINAGLGQLLAQLIEVATIFVTVFIIALVFFKILQALGLLRATREAELKGLDIAEMGMPGYVGDQSAAGGFDPIPPMQPALAPASPYGNYTTPSWSGPSIEPSYGGGNQGGYNNPWGNNYPPQPQQPRPYAGYGQQPDAGWNPQGQPRYGGQPDMGMSAGTGQPSGNERWGTPYQQQPRYTPPPVDPNAWGGPVDDAEVEDDGPIWSNPGASANPQSGGYRYGSGNPAQDFGDSANSWGGQQPPRPNNPMPTNSANGYDDMAEDATWSDQEESNTNNDWYATDQTPSNDDDAR